jgi:hypothetical protein
MIGFSASDVAAFVERIQAEMKKNFIPDVSTLVKGTRKTRFFAASGPEKCLFNGFQSKSLGKILYYRNNYRL